MKKAETSLDVLKNFHKKTGMFLSGKNLYIKKEIPVRIYGLRKNKKPAPKIKSVLDNIPKGATHANGNYFYKKGSHGFYFIYLNEDWKRCEKEEFRKARYI